MESIFEPKQQYSSVLKDVYDTVVERVNFNDSVHTAKLVNTWVNTLTQGHIKEIVNQGKKEKLNHSSVLTC